ncbi:TonB-dependent receptor plug domain-containing protein [Salibacteraceae bacterium]|nr:TonB-dependent receptor plug domain-containing protein [Salibacteraceae bacterium]MDB9710158.1 TonB-dependent receptor plug domain-containing protein [Salibacteraceae bacterium]
MRKFLLIVLGLLITTVSSYAQGGQGGIKATVTEASNGLPIPFANVAVKQNGSLITGGSTDFDGVVEIKPIPPGRYDIEITSLGFGPIKVTGINVSANKTTFVPKTSTGMASSAVALTEFIVTEYKKPLIEQDGAATTETVTSDEISRMAARNPADLAATAGGTYSKDDGTGTLNMRGGRGDANYYYIDGIKVRGSSAIPQSSIEQVSVITGGLPSQYGDVTGGVIAITTKGVSREYHGGIEFLTSGIGGDDGYVGVDPYGYNLAEFSLSGPLLQKRDSSGNKEPLLGFFVSGNVTSNRDSRPSAVGAWQVNDDVLTDLKENPLRVGFTPGSVLSNADFLRLNDFERVSVRPNTNNVGANIAGKIDVVTTSSTNLTFGGSLNYSKGRRYNFNQALFDSESYPEQTSVDWRAYARFTQRFKNSESEDEGSASLIKNAYYTIQADYSQQYDRRWDPDHKDNFFDYGYIGKFDVQQGADYVTGTDSLTGIFGDIQGTFRDTLITFTPGDANPDLARFTQRYYELNGWDGFDAEGNPVYDAAQAEAYTNYNNIQAGGGLINGDNLSDRSRDVYGMWVYNNDVTNGRGSASDNYLEAVTNQIRVTGQGSADIGNHNFVLGFEYEQRIDRSYSLSPRRLWQIARLRSNTHIEQLDFSNPIIEYPGPQVSYTRLNASPGEYTGADDPQSFIDYNLRQATGLDPDGVDFLDVNNIDPSAFELEYFSPDELFNNGTGSLVNYYGYDPYGNRTSSTSSFSDFFNAVDENGNYTRPIAPYQPIYVSGFIEDKFEFDDLIFRIGLRVDRFDANQQVLKDQYVLFPTVKARETEALDLLPEGVNAHPGNIGEDYVVYVDNVQNPTSILGYRDGDIWYNAQGTELNDGSALKISNGLPAPLLVDKEKTSSLDITEDSFEDYAPQTNFMPRVAFSFPISDEANFFAHYDVLTKRPTQGNRLDPSDYYFLESRASSAELDNPDLKPERTIDYEVGFQQALTNSMALKISAFYRESRDMVQVTRIFDAYPIEYNTFRNLDFATVKGLTMSYDLRRTNNLTIRASYTLQFAEGTGSGSTSQLNLARSGQANLRAPIRLSYDQRHAVVANIDYRYGEKENYNGPMIGDKAILKNTGFNLQMRAGSGSPYNPQGNYTSTQLFTVTPSPLQQGAINSASLPWTFRFDFVLDRDFTYKMGASGREFGINAYVQVLNLLNARNINDVYRATGNPDDDGYLNSANGLNFIAQQNSAASFTEYYAMKLWDPTNWQLPRRIRLGVRVNF